MEELSQSLSQATLKLPQFAFIKTHGCEGFGLTKKQKELIDRHLSIITLVASGDTCYVGYKGFDKALLRVLEEVSKAATTPDGGGGGGGPATTAPTTLWERSPGGDEMRRTFSTLLSSPDFNTAAGVSVYTTLLNPTVQWHFENVHREGSFKPVIMMYDTTSNQTIDDSWHDGTRIMPPTFTLLDLAKNMSKYGQLYPPNAPMVPTAPAPAPAGGGADGGTPAHAYLVIFSCRVPCWTPPRIVPRKTFARNNGKRRRLLGLHEAMWHPGSGQHIKKRKGGTRAGKRRRVKRWESRGRKNKRKCRTHRRRRRRRRQRKTRRRRRR